MFSRSLPVLRRSFKELPIPRNRTSIPLLSTRVTPAFTYRILRHYSTPSVLPPPIDIPVTSSSEQAQPVKLLSIEPRFSMTMTCTVTDCGTRSTHEFTKRAYTKGLVIIQCPGCKNRHLIADHLGWFKDTDGAGRTIEDIMKLKGEKVRRGALVGEKGDIEYYEDS